MAPAANTARARRAHGSATALPDSDSDMEYHAYNGRLKEASAARARLRKAKQARDTKRAALCAAYESALSAIEARVLKAVSKHKDLRSATHVSRLQQLREAMDRRDAKLVRITRKLAEHQRLMLNLAVQLLALYEGRREDVAGLLRERDGGSGWEREQGPKEGLN
ncbi:BZIP domain-containing protein [Madurella fahalii]|uniref:BZIP domain-containing protein n=1 Tax=Madurella fahalii TaxID=1157608 RepID=A0ABQ0FZ67_9PEZI